MKVETTLKLGAPPEEVFDLLMDPHRLGEWVTAHRSVSGVPDGELKMGSTFKQRLRLARVEFEVEWKVVRLERPSLAEWQGRGPRGTEARVVYRLEPEGEGTDFHYLNELKLPGGPAGIAAGKLASKPAEQAMKHSLKTLKKIFG
jgi:carbon monoxide dehydrogenase subunit G